MGGAALHRAASPPALFRLIDQLGRASGLARNGTPAAKLEKLESSGARTHNIRKMLFVSVAPYCCSSSPKLYVPSKKHNAFVAKFGQLTVTRA